MVARIVVAGSLTAGILVSGGTALPAGTVQRILIKSAAFAPEEARVHVGDVVEWENQDIVAHTATATEKSWNINLLPGKRGQTTMQAAGTFSYICRYHPNMTGKIIVEP
jgi:plastocyanin